MARLRQLEVPASTNSFDIPAELLDHDSPVWRDSALCRRWHETNVGRPPVTVDGSTYQRYQSALESWSKLRGLMTDDAHPSLDYERLAPLGLTRIKSLERARMSSSDRRSHGC